MSNETQIYSSEVIFWNIWGHRHPPALNLFFKKHSPTADVICLTEVTDVAHEVTQAVGTSLKYGENPDEAPQHVNGRMQLQNELGDRYNHIYDSSRRSNWTCERNDHIFSQVGFGSMLLVKKELTVIETGQSLICSDIADIRSRVVQWIVYEKSGVRYLVAHLHGIWIAENTKGDHPARMVQSVQLLTLIESVVTKHEVHKVVFGGDLNLDITTRALHALCAEESQRVGPFRNLIKEYGITDTRTTEYRKYDWPGESKFADYVFVGKNVEVTRMDVLNQVTASDHAPLILEFQ